MSQNPRFRGLEWLLCLALLAGCGSDPTDPGPGVPDKGSRLLGLAATPAAGQSAEAAWQQARALGAEFPVLFFPWDQLEAEMESAAPTNSLTLANATYGGAGTPVLLVIGIRDRTAQRFPPDLAGLEVNDPNLINRYNTFTTWMFAQIPDLDLIGLSLGREVDAGLGEDTDAIQAYQDFFEVAAAQARLQRPNLTVGVETGFNAMIGLASVAYRGLHASADAAFIAYSPIEADYGVRPATGVPGDIDDLVGIFTQMGETQPIALTAAAFPVSATLGGSLVEQGGFVNNVFRAWDTHAETIRFVAFGMLTDLAPENVDALTLLYGTTDARFEAFLGSRGFRDHATGTARDALGIFESAAGARGW